MLFRAHLRLPLTLLPQTAARNGVTGLLAHNYLSGTSYFQLQLGQQVRLVYGDGRIARYQVSVIQRYQKVDSNSTSSPLIDLSQTRH